MADKLKKKLEAVEDMRFEVQVCVCLRVALRPSEY